MKRIYRSVMSILVILCFACIQKLYATRLYQERGIYPNQSSEYVRTLNRSASTEADAAFYNPAGLAFMEGNGLYIMYSSQTYYARKEHTMDYYAIKLDNADFVQTWHTRDDFTGGLPDFYYAETVAPVLPDFDIIYKDQNWVMYLDISVLQAANGMYFPNGAAVIDWGNLATKETELAMAQTDIFNAYHSDSSATRTEYFLGATFGGVYKLKDWLSLAAGLRYIYGTGNMTIENENVSYTINNVTTKDPESEWHISTDYFGSGFSLILGLHARLSEKLDLGFKIETHTPMTMEKNTVEFDAASLIEASGSLNDFKDGSPSSQMEYSTGNGKSSFTMQYPTQLNFGISYKFLTNLRAESSLEITLRNNRDMDGREEDYKEYGYSAGACVEWGFMKNVVGSLGYLYTDFGIKDDKRNETDMLLPNHTFGFGLGMALSNRLDLSLGWFFQTYERKGVYSTEFTDVTEPTYHAIYKEFYEKRFSVAIGFTYQFEGPSGQDIQ